MADFHVLDPQKKAPEGLKGLGQLKAQGAKGVVGSEWDIITVFIHFCFNNTEKNDDQTQKQHAPKKLQVQARERV